MQTLELKLQNSLPVIEKLLLLGIKIGIFLVLLVPLVVTKFGIYPIVSSKAIYYYVLIELILLLYIWLLLIKKRYLPKISPVFISVLIFIEIAVLSTLRSINPWRSFWGTMERMEGLILILHLFVFFLVLVGVFQQKRDWFNFLRFTVLVSIPVGLAGFIQKFGVFYFYTDPNDPRISATFGNPVFYGNYLVLIIILSLFLIFLEKNNQFKILFTGTLIFNSFLLLLTGTRGAWMGIISAIFFLIVTWFFLFSKKREGTRMALLFGIFIFLLFFLLFLLFSDIGYLPETTFLMRFESIFDVLAEFKNARLSVWSLGINAWKDSPLLGHGLESFSYIYDRYYQASLLGTISESLFFDRAHNKIVDTLTASGIVGLLGYFAIFITALFVILRNYKNKFSLFPPFVLIAFLLGYFVQNIFSFDTISTYLIFFLVLGFIDVNFKKEKSMQIINQEQEFRSNVFTATGKFWIKAGIAFLVFVLAGLIIFVVNIQPFKVKLQLIDANQLLRDEKIEESFTLFEEVFNGPKFTRLESSHYAAEMVFYAAPSPKYKDFKKEFSQELQKIASLLEGHLEGKKETLQMRSYFLLAQIYKNLYLVENNPQFLDNEERILGKAIRLNPNFPKIYRLSGEMRFLQGRKKEGMVFFSKALELDNNWANFYEWLGMSYIQAGEEKNGADALRKSFVFGDFYTKRIFNFDIVWKLADIYEEKGNYSEMAAFYEEVISRYPFNPLTDQDKRHAQLYASLSTVYVKMGDEEKARQTTEEMLRFYPDLWPVAQEFLSTLKNNKEQ